MNDLNQILILGVVGSTLASALVLMAGFTAWIGSLKADLDVHAPLLDGPRRGRKHWAPAASD